MGEYSFEKKKLKNYLGEKLYKALKDYKVMIAGGTITSLFTNSEINDIDIYFRSKEDISKFLIEEMNGRWVLAKTDKAFLFKYNEIEVQAIYFKYFNTPQEIFDTFDFTVCMGAYDFETEEFVLHEDFLKHNAQRILKFNQNTAYPIVSALRVDKYKKKGYKISKVEFIRIMLTILQFNITDYKTLKEQMGGMYGENYDALLEPGENEEFDLNTIIEKMADLSVEDNYFNESKPLDDIDNWEEYVRKALGEKFKCFKHNDDYYKIIGDEIKSCEDYNEDNYYLVDVNELIQFPLIRYKYVNRNLHSFYDDKYVYKVGEYNEPFRKDKGLFAVTKDNIDTCQYSSKSNGVLLEFRIDTIDDVCNMTKLLADTSSFNKVFVTRIVPQEEVETMIKEIDKSNCPFE